MQDDKLDEILQCLQRMDRRDRLRSIGGILRGLIQLLPIALILGSAWYFYGHSDEILRKIAKTAAEQTMSMSEGMLNNAMMKGR